MFQSKLWHISSFPPRFASQNHTTWLQYPCSIIMNLMTKLVNSVIHHICQAFQLSLSCVTMPFSKLSRNQLPSLPAIEKRISDVQNARFDWASVCSTEMMEFLESHAKSIGVPKEFLFFPLLTVASLMRTSTTIEINKKWREPALLWFVIASKNNKWNDKYKLQHRWIYSAILRCRATSPGRSWWLQRSPALWCPARNWS